MSEIVYSLSSNFSGNIREDQLHSEIVANSSISTSLDGIIKNGDVVTVKFFGNLIGNEGNVLNQIVNSHLPDYTPERRVKMNLPVVNNIITSSSWTRVGLGKFPGTNLINDITYVDVLSYMDDSLDSYDVKLIDRGNADTICIQTLNNTKLLPQYLGDILYQPPTETDLECFAKVNGNSAQNVTIQAIDIWYAS